MPFDLFALSSQLPLTKTISKAGKTPYPMVRDFVSHAYRVDSLEDFHRHLLHVAERRWCLLKGQLATPLHDEPRAGSTDPMAPTSWVCLDVDGLAAASVDEVLERLGLADVSHVIQYSSSAGLVEGRIFAHIFMLLDATQAPENLKSWLMWLNLEYLAKDISLNRLGTALRWPLDVTTCQNDKLLYVAPPVFQGVTDPMAARISIVQRANATIPSRRLDVQVQALHARKMTRLHDLRKDAGLPKLRDSQFKIMDGHQVLLRPGVMKLTGVKEERGYRYFNMNGGDSWAYYQPVDDERYVFNFKGEPVYQLSEIAPEYWASLKKAKQREAAAGVHAFSFIEPARDTIYNATLDKRTGDIELLPCKNERHAQLFLNHYGLELPDKLPTMRIGFDPKLPHGPVEGSNLLNTYRPPVFRDSETPEDVPPTIKRVIEHAVGTGRLYNEFLRWVRAVVVQREHTGVAWVLHGEPGTGKGVLFNHVLAPLVGRSNARVVGIPQLTERYNGWAVQKLLVGIDEIETEALGSQARAVEAALKLYITEPMIEVREMRQNSATQPNFLNLVFMSNRPSPIKVDPGDRRYQIGTFQKNKIKLDERDIVKIHEELPSMYSWLVAQEEVSLDSLRVLVQSQDRERLIDLNKTTIDSVFDHVNAGNLEFFFEQLDTLGESSVDCIEYDVYRSTLYQIALRASNSPDQAYITRVELFHVLNYLAGKITRAPHRFASLLKHHRVYLERRTPDGQAGVCVHVRWNVSKEWCLEHIKKYLADQASMAKNVRAA